MSSRQAERLAHQHAHDDQRKQGAAGRTGGEARRREEIFADEQRAHQQERLHMMVLDKLEDCLAAAHEREGHRLAGALRGLVIVGVVGVLQFDVLKYRLENEYNVDIILESTPYQFIRWITSDSDYKALDLASDTKVVADFKENKLLLFRSEWSIDWALEHNKDLRLQEFGNAE